MKKPLQNLFLVSLLGLNLQVLAQPVITAAGFTPNVGASITGVSNQGGISAGSSGASQIWDLSALGNTNASTSNYVSVASTATGSMFPTATIAVTTANITGFYRYTASQMQNVGLTAGTVNFIYSDPEDYLRFPFTMGSTFTDHFKCTFTSGIDFYREGNTTVTADGYGTVITPNGTYTNVLRVHLVQQYSDSSSFMTLNYLTDIYWWIKDGIPSAIASLSSIDNDGTISYSGAYLTGNVGLADQSKVFNSIDLYPVPAQNELNVALNSDKYQKSQFKITNSLGQAVIEQKNYAIQAGNNLFNIDIAKLSEGVYFLQIILDNGSVETKKFTVN